MKRFVKLLLVTFGFGVFGLAMSLVPQKNATGAAGAPVNIVSPLPLPVTGNVNATVAGTVGISGIPTVDIGTMPTVTLGNATVSTTSTAGRNIVRLLGSNQSSGPFLNDLNGNQYRVPSGERLVINFGNIAVSGPPGFTPAVQLSIYQALSSVNTLELYLNLPVTKLPFSLPGGDSYVATVSGPLYIDQNLPIIVLVTNASAWQAFFQGYLVDCGVGCTQ